MKIGDKVQVWDETSHTPLGWGTIVAIDQSAEAKENIPLIQLEGKSGKKIWGNECSWITEEAAVKGGIRIFKDMEKGDKK